MTPFPYRGFGGNFLKSVIFYFTKNNTINKNQIYSQKGCHLGKFWFFIIWKKLSKFILSRKKIALNYDKLLKKNVGLINLPNFEENKLSSWHLYQIKIDFKKRQLSKKKIIETLLKKKIITQIHYIPIYKYKIYKNLKKKIHKNSDIFYGQIL